MPILKEPHACGAKTRSGAPCKNAAMPNGRCRMHGGLTPNKAGALFSKYLTAEDVEIYNAAAGYIGSVDAELALVKTQLARALRIESETAGVRQVLTEQTKLEQGETCKYYRHDFEEVIERLIGRIASLEECRMDLVAKDLDAKIKRAQIEGQQIENGGAPERKRIMFEIVEEPKLS